MAEMRIGGPELIPLRAGIYTSPGLIAALFSEARAVTAQGYGMPVFSCFAPVQELQDRWNNPAVKPFAVVKDLVFNPLLIQGYGHYHRRILAGLTQIPKGCIAVLFIDQADVERVSFINVDEGGLATTSPTMQLLLPKQPLFVDWEVKPLSREEWPRICAVCKAEGDHVKKLCSVCRAFRYCSEACQKADWAEHKNECKQLVDLCARNNHWLD